MSAEFKRPEFVQIIGSTDDVELANLRGMKLVELLRFYQGHIWAYYSHVHRYGELPPPLQGDEEFTGSDEQRDRWKYAARRYVLWQKISAYNGEILRRIYAGRSALVNQLDDMRKQLDESIRLDGGSVDDEP